MKKDTLLARQEEFYELNLLEESLILRLYKFGWVHIENHFASLSLRGYKWLKNDAFEESI